MPERPLDLSVPIDKLPKWVYLLSAVLFALPAALYVLVYRVNDLLADVNFLILAVAFFVLIVAHEVVHALGWKFAANLPWSALSFGIQWKTLSPYCHASVPMLVSPYRIGAVLPLIVTGIWPYAVGFVLQDMTLVVLGATMISAAVGDIFVLWTLRAIPSHAKVLDHPTNAGCMVMLGDEAMEE